MRLIMAGRRLALVGGRARAVNLLAANVRPRRFGLEFGTLAACVCVFARIPQVFASGARQNKTCASGPPVSATAASAREEEDNSRCSLEVGHLRGRQRCISPPSTRFAGRQADGQASRRAGKQAAAHLRAKPAGPFGGKRACASGPTKCLCCLQHSLARALIISTPSAGGEATT